jgi:hypothetical protein
MGVSPWYASQPIPQAANAAAAGNNPPLDRMRFNPRHMWPRPATVVSEPVLLGHGVGDIATSGYVASTTLPHPRLHAVALFEGFSRAFRGLVSNDRR